MSGNFKFKALKIITQHKYDRFINDLKIRLKPLLMRWLQLSIREKQLVIALLSAFGIFILVSIVGSAIDITDRMYNKNIILQTYQLDSQVLNREFKELSQTTANEFSEVSVARIKGDVTQALSVKEPDVTLQDNMLILKGDNILFESVILLLEQLRKSYGIFPTKLKMTQSRSGYINFNATFLVNQ
ncbi:MAG: hypothetical protein LW807_01985 [Proteobacteria bacterium]|jgi:hypothetical protein|nr:hypothetical protein [Pseudomonadota bacterium]